MHSRKKKFKDYWEFAELQDKKVRIAIAISALGLLLFIAFALTFPFYDNLFTRLFPKSPSLADVTAPTVVQSNTATVSSGSDVSISWGSPTSNGNFLIAVLAAQSGDEALSISQAPQGWTLVSDTINEEVRQWVYAYANAPEQSGEVKFTLSSGVKSSLVVAEYKDVAKENAIETQNSLVGNNDSPTGSVDPNTDYNLVIAAVSSVVTSSESASFNNATNDFSLVGQTSTTGDAVNIATALFSSFVANQEPVNNSVTIGSGTQWIHTMVAIKPVVPIPTYTPIPSKEPEPTPETEPEFLLQGLDPENTQQSGLRSLALESTQISGTTYYVDCQNGNDSNNGRSEGAAWKSLNKINNATLNPGDGILLKRDCSWTGTLDAAWNGTAQEPITIGAYGEGVLPTIKYDGSKGGGPAVKVSGSYVVIDSLKATLTNPNRSSDCTLADGQKQHFGYYQGFNLSGHHLTLQNSEATGNSLGVFTTDSSHHNKILNNHIHHNDGLWRIGPIPPGSMGGMGMNLHGDDHEVAHNFFEKNDANCDPPDHTHRGYSAAIELYNASRAHVHHNKMVGHRKHFEMGKNSDEISDDNIFAYNLIVSNLANAKGPNIHGAGNKFGPVKRTTVVNNTIYLVGSGNTQALNCGCTDGATIRNNIFWAEEKVAFFNGTYTESNNIYWDSDGNPNAQNLSLHATSKKTNPQFVKAAVNDGDFRLKAGSPAIDAGISVGYDLDVEGVSVPQGSKVDIGAIEYTGQVVTTPTPTASTVTPTPGVQEPFSGSRISLPGTIQAEDFDNGGATVAYVDNDTGNNGNIYRQTDVDIEATTDTGGGYNLGWTRPGEWVEYSVNVSYSGSYTIGTRVASNGGGGVFHIEVDGTDVTGPMTVPNTGGNQIWQTVEKTGVQLTAGQHIVRLSFDNNGATQGVGNFNYMTFTFDPGPQTPYTGTPISLPGIIQAEDFDNGGVMAAYFDQDAGNKGNVYRETDVDIEATTDTGGGYNLAWMWPNEWVEYTVNVTETSTYTVGARVASNGGGGVFHIEVDGQDVTGSMTVPSTGGNQVWQTVEKTGIQLSAGQHIIRLSMDSSGAQQGIANFNYLEFTQDTSTSPVPSTSQEYTLSGSVYVDVNRNGVKDTDELGHNGAEVTVSGGLSASTNASGLYTLTVPAAVYTVTITIPDGYEGTTTNPLSISVSANTSANFGIAPTATGGRTNSVFTVNAAKTGTELNGQPFQVVGIRVSNALINDAKTQQLIDNLDVFRTYGINTVSVFFQGSRFGDIKGYREDTTLNPTYAARMARIIEEADKRKMVVLVGVLYYGDATFAKWDSWGQTEANSAVANTVQWLKDNNYRNVFIDVDNEQMSPFDSQKLIAAGKAVDASYVIGSGGKITPSNADLSLHQGGKNITGKPYIESEGTPQGYWGAYSRQSGDTQYRNIGIYTSDLKSAWLSETSSLLNQGKGYMGASTWLQADLPEGPNHIPGGNGTSADPGIKFWLEHVKSLVGPYEPSGIGEETTPTPTPSAITPTPTQPPTGGTGAFLENNGQLVIEVEDYNDIFPSTFNNYTQTHNWEKKTNIPDYSGSGFMHNIPDERGEDGVGPNSPRGKGGPEMRYPIKISTPGTYNVWVRGYTTGGESNGVHIGVDGVMTGTEAGASNMSGFRPKESWIWESARKEGYTLPATLNLTAGYHTLNVWGRDDGFRMDKIVLRIGSGVPSGTGPAQSAREAIPTPIITPTPTPVVTTTPTPTPSVQAPFTGTPISLPGTIQVEDFDNGGANVAYFDTSAGNNGGVYRDTDVDLQATTDTGGGYGLEFTRSGEWLEYTVDVAEGGTYDIGVRVASKVVGGAFHIEIDGQDVTGPMYVPNTGDWQTWTTIEKTGIQLTAGEHVVRLSLDSSGEQAAIGNINYITFTKVVTIPTYTLSGTVYVDANNNGIQDTDEADYANAIIELYEGPEATDIPYHTAETNTAGAYTFNTLNQGVYTVSLLIPDGYSVTTAIRQVVSLTADTIVNFGIASTQTPTITPTPVSPSNLLKNGGLESSTTVWGLYGGASIMQGTSHGGSKAIRVGNASGGGESGAEQAVAAQPGKTYSLTAWGMMSNSAQSDKGAVGIKFKNSAGDVLGNETSIFIPETDWTQKQVSAIAPANTASVVTYVYKEVGDNTFLYIDDFTLTESGEVTTPTPTLTNTPTPTVAQNTPTPTPVQLSDLVVSDITWSPSNATVGQNVTFGATLRNIGSAATPDATAHGVAFYVNGVKVSWSINHNASIAPGDSVTVTANGGPEGSRFWTATAGTHEIEAVVDEPGRITESNEENNTASNQFTIVAAPTVTPTPTSVPTYTVDGTVYVDTNKNGVQDTDEAGYADAVVMISTNPETAGISDENGRFILTGINQGVYTVTLSAPNGYTITTSNPIEAVVTANTTINFGIGLIPTPTPTAPVITPTLTTTPTPTATATPIPTVTPLPTGTQSVTYSVPWTSEDVQETNTSFTVNDTTLRIGGCGQTACYTGLRFTNINLPKGSIINSAYVEYNAAQSNSLANVAVEIAGHDSDNSSLFSSSNKPSQRTLTAAKVTPQTDTVVAANQWYRLGNISSIVQEVIDRDNWQTGNSISLIIRATSPTEQDTGILAHSYDGNSERAPRLVIIYSSPIGGEEPTNTPVPITEPTEAPIPTYILSGTVYVDTNKNGVKDIEESGQSNITVSLSNGASVSTDAQGRYQFTDLIQELYTVTATVPNGYTLTTQSSIPVSLIADTSVHFGMVQVPIATVTATSAPTPTPIPCSLVSAKWQTTNNQIDEGEIVGLEVITSGNCVGEELEFEVREDDGIMGSDATNIIPATVPIIGNNAQTSWIVEWQQDCMGFALCQTPEYYYIVRIVGTTTEIRSTNPTLKVQRTNKARFVTIPHVDVTQDTVKITWKTSHDMSSQISYGLSAESLVSTDEINTNIRAADHAITIDNLLPCTAYRYQVRSREITGDMVESPFAQFITKGCEGNSSVLALSTTDVDPASGGVVELIDEETDKGILLQVPAGFSSRPAQFQMKKLEQSPVLSELSVPSGRSLVGSHIYNLAALTNISSKSATFEEPILVTINYLPSEVSNLATLAMYRNNGQQWTQLENCTHNQTEASISCNTTAFSVFALFSETPASETNQPPKNQNSNSSGGNSSTGGSGGSSGDSSGGSSSTANGPDLNKDGKINIFDLSILLSQWNRSGSGDLNNDGKVNIFDLSQLLVKWTR